MSLLDEQLERWRVSDWQEAAGMVEHYLDSLFLLTRGMSTELREEVEGTLRASLAELEVVKQRAR